MGGYAPSQFTTGDGTLVGLVNGVNPDYSFTPQPSTFVYSVQNVTGSILFRNGLLVDQPADYSSGPGYFDLTVFRTTDTVTAEIYQSGGPTRLRFPIGITGFGSQSLRLTPNGPNSSCSAAFMLFRNGQLLTNGADYSLIGSWITLLWSPGRLPTDTFSAMIGVGGTACTTYDGSISGAINGTNAVFTLPSSVSALMLFRNGQFLTRGLDYVQQNGNQVVLLGSQIPHSGDTLTAQIGVSPVQVTNFDGSLSNETAVRSLLFRNGIFMTPPLDAAVTGNSVAFVPAQIPQTTDVVTVRAWTPDPVFQNGTAFNLPVQAAPVGTVDGVSNVFTLATQELVTAIQVFRNGLFLSAGGDYNWTCLQNSSAGPWLTTITTTGAQIPQPGDVVTVQVYSE